MRKLIFLAVGLAYKKQDLTLHGPLDSVHNLQQRVNYFTMGEDAQRVIWSVVSKVKLGKNYYLKMSVESNSNTHQLMSKYIKCQYI